MTQKNYDGKAILQASGYKATDQRLAIVGYLKIVRRPLSAQAIIEKFAKTIDQATVYRTLKSLKEKNIIRQVDLRHNHAHYELADLAEHHHLICTHCGKIEDVNHRDGETMESAVLKKSKHFATIDQHALEFYGVCKACAKKLGGA
jgi:Fe2+ or Zn2+ uptake regulation protein